MFSKSPRSQEGSWDEQDKYEEGNMDKITGSELLGKIRGSTGRGKRGVALR